MSNYLKHFKTYFPIILITLLVIVQFYLYRVSENNLIKEYEDDILSDINSLYDVSVNNKFNVTQMLYSMLITDDIKSLIEEPSDENRIQLSLHLNDDYNLMKKIGIQQFQFHLPNGDSYYRFHAPDRFGDNLLEIRASVANVIDTKALTLGYEEGRVYGGQRYVYPIFVGKSYIGSVEWSYSISSIINPIMESKNLQSIFLLNSDEVNLKSFDETMDNYTFDTYSELGYYSPNYNVEKTINELFISVDNYKKLTQLLKDKDDEKSFDFLKTNDQLFWIASKKIYDVTGKEVGVILFLKSDRVLYDMLQQREWNLISNIVLTLALLILFYYGFVYFITNKSIAVHDRLTNLYNRHVMTESLAETFKNGVVLMIDIDDFKCINDKYGHNYGDRVLIEVAKRINSQIRKNDLAIRWGGEEFLVLLNNIDLEQGKVLGSRILDEISIKKIENSKVTVSIGMCAFDDHYEKSIRRADDAMYQSKMNGKNRIEIH